MKRDIDVTPRNCYECHFLCTRSPFSKSLSDAGALAPEQREKLIDGTYFDHIDPTYTHIACALGRWLYKSGRELLDDLRKEMLKPRGDSCRWFPRSPEMGFAVGADLEERMTYRREADRDRNLAKWGVWVAALALVLSLGWNVGWGIWAHFNPPKTGPQNAAMSAPPAAEPSAPKTPPTAGQSHRSTADRVPSETPGAPSAGPR